MSFTVDLTRFIEKTKGNADKVVRETTIMLAQSVVVKTPVDTGRARGNWVFGAGSPDISTTENTDKSGAKTISKMVGQIGRTGAGGVTYITNSLPYIERLENGWSDKAPNGMIGLTVREFQDYVNQAAAKVKR